MHHSLRVTGQHVLSTELNFVDISTDKALTSQPLSSSSLLLSKSKKMATVTSSTATLCFLSQNHTKTTLGLFSSSSNYLPFSISKPNYFFLSSIPSSKSNIYNAAATITNPMNTTYYVNKRFSSNCISTATPNTNYEVQLSHPSLLLSFQTAAI